jgi:hypothetical protein
VHRRGCNLIMPQFKRRPARGPALDMFMYVYNHFRFPYAICSEFVFVSCISALRLSCISCIQRRMSSYLTTVWGECLCTTSCSAYRHTCMTTLPYSCLYGCVCVWVHMHNYAAICLCACACVCVCCVHKYIFVYTYVYIYIHVYSLAQLA